MEYEREYSFGASCPLTLDEVREIARQLSSANVKPFNGHYAMVVTEEVATDLFVMKHFPSWMKYV